MNWREFKPTILFLAKFLGFYLVANLIYGAYVTAYSPGADPVTIAVTNQCAQLLSLFGWPSAVTINTGMANVPIIYNHRTIVWVYEGCNGLNVSIVFLSFLLAFGPISKRLYWFVPLGLFVIHLSNLARIILLFFVVLYRPGYAYFAHKYLFTAVIYAIIFLMWLIWVLMNRNRQA